MWARKRPSRQPQQLLQPPPNSPPLPPSRSGSSTRLPLPSGNPTPPEIAQYLWSADIFHSASHTPPDQRVMVTSTYLADPYALWLRAMCATREHAGLSKWLDWAAFSRELAARHTPATHYVVSDRFAAVHQTGSVTGYIATFNQLCPGPGSAAPGWQCSR